MAQFQIQIPNLLSLQNAMRQYSAIATPIMQKAVLASQAILAKFTTAGIVPVRTGYLVQNWRWDPDPGGLRARWYPRATYAPYVEFGTPPHTIRAVNKRVLANKETGQIFGTKVEHPGTAPNPFMERIIASAQPEITSLFETALTQITDAIALQGS